MKNLKYYFLVIAAFIAFCLTLLPAMAQASTPFPIATAPTEHESSIAAAFDGTNYLVVIVGEDDAPNNIAAQFIDQSGNLVGSKIVLGQSDRMELVAFDGTNYLVVWASMSDIVYGQLISTSGSLVGASFVIASTADETEGIAYGGGKYLVVYDRSSVVYGRIVSPAGAVGSEIAISSGYGHQGVKNVAFDGANFFVVWTDGTNDSEVKGRFISPSGALGTEISINASSDPSDNPLTLAFDGTNYLVVYTDEFGGSGSGNWDVHGQMVTPAGALSGGVIFISTASGQQFLPLVAFDGTNYLVTWTDMRNDTNQNWTCDTDEGTCWDIYGQYVSKTGTLVGSEFIVNNDAGDQLGGVGGFNSGKYLALITTGSWDLITENFINGDVYGDFLNTQYNAAGTYTWNSGTGALGLNWTSSDFICDGPELGLESMTGVTIDSTTMTWPPPDGMTWTRVPGTPGDIVGVWTFTDAGSGNSYTLTVNGDGTFLLAATILQCSGEGGEENPRAWSNHWSTGYYVPLGYKDPTQTTISVSVTGPGITGSLSLAYDENWGGWNSWILENTPFLGTTSPTGLPYTYTFTITDGTGTWTAPSTVSYVVEPFATGLAPTGTVSVNPAFAWAEVSGNYTYGVELHDNSGATIWSVYDLTTPAAAYPGSPALTEGMTYNYNILVTDAYGNSSYAQASFVYQTTPTPLYVVWQDDTYGNFEIFLKKSTDNGANWTTTRLTNNAGSSQAAAIAVNGGNTYIVWHDDTYGNNEIYLKKSTDEGANWTTTRLTDNAGSSVAAAIAVSGNDVYVVWQDDTYGNYEIYLKKSTDNGATWTTTRLTNNAGNSQSPSIVLNGTIAYVVWQDDTYGNNEIYLKKSTDGGLNWTTTRLTNNAGNSQFSTISRDAVDGSLYVVWQDDTYGNNEIYLKKSTDGGTNWTTTRLTNNAGNSQFPSIVVNGGIAYVVWQDDTYGNNEIYIKKSTDGGLNWTTTRLTNNAGNSQLPVISRDPVDNSLYVVWQDDTYGNNEIYLKKSIDGGTNWTTTRLTNNAGNSVMSVLVK